MSTGTPPGAAPGGPPPGPPGVPPIPQGPFIDLSSEPMPAKAMLLVAPVTAFFGLALVCIGLRLWSKRIKKTSFRLSDYAILVAALFSTGFLTICWLVVDRGGVGFPLRQVAPPQRKFTQQSFIVAWLLQAWGNTFVRLSILDFMAQIFSVKKFRMVVHGFQAATVAYLIGCTITFFAICRPLRYNWTPGPGMAEHCGNLELKFLLSAIFNLVLDVCILVLPMPMLWTLQLNSRKKLALTFVFGLGIFVCFSTAWRTYHVVKFATPEAKLNFTITIVEDALWSGLEINLGIINACLPVMPPALSRIFKLPFLRYISFSTWRGTKPSKGSSQDSSGKSSYPSSRSRSWMRLGSSTKSEKGVISRQTELTVDIESESTNQIPMERMGSQTRLAASPWEYQYAHGGQGSLADDRVKGRAI